MRGLSLRTLVVLRLVSHVAHELSLYGYVIESGVRTQTVTLRSVHVTHRGLVEAKSKGVVALSRRLATSGRGWPSTSRHVQCTLQCSA